MRSDAVLIPEVAGSSSRLASPTPDMELARDGTTCRTGKLLEKLSCTVCSMPELRTPHTRGLSTAAMPVFHDAVKRVAAAVRLAVIAAQQVPHLPILVQLAERLIVGQSQPQPRPHVLPDVLQQQRTHLNIDRGVPLSLQQDLGWCGSLGVNASNTEDPLSTCRTARRKPLAPLSRSNPSGMAAWPGPSITATGQPS